MRAGEQRATAGRYALVPRTVVFLRDGDNYLLIKGSPGKALWSERYNGIGGHVERGEDIMSSARRELLEETGMDAPLWLCGTVIVDAGHTGIGLYVFTGKASPQSPRPSVEGTVEWISYEQIASLPTVDDVPKLVARIHRMTRGDPPFSARSYYDAYGKLEIEFVD